MIIDSKFHRVIEKYCGIPFSYGTNDCGMFVANIIRDVTDTDPAADIRGTYEPTEYAALRKIVELGGWEKLLTDRGFIKIDKNYTSRGDVCVAENALGMWVGNFALFANGVSRPIDKIDAVYRYQG